MAGHARGAAWVVLVTAGSTMATFNIWHALHAGPIPLLLALMTGAVPVGLAVGLSHIVAAHHGGWVMRAAVFAVMAGAMVLSIRATGYVVRPATGPLWWLFGLVDDAAALVALQVLLAPVPAPATAPAEAVPDPVEVPAQVPPEVPQDVPSQVPSARASDEQDARAARAAYRRSVAEGHPLSQAALGTRYGRSKTWGRNRIDEVKAAPVAAAQ